MRRVALKVVVVLGVLGLSIPVVASMANADDPVACDPLGAATVSVESADTYLGGTVHVTGSGWCHPEGGGSGIAVKIDDGAISRLDTSLHANQTIWAIVNAEADGTFSTEIELPDGTTASSSPVLAAGSHTLRFLSGSLKQNDMPRSVLSESFTVASSPPEPTDPPTPRATSTPTPTPTPTATPTATPTPTPTATATGTQCTPTTGAPAVTLAQTSVSFDGTLRITGTGWCHPTDGGSAVAIKIDDGAISRLDTSLNANKTIWAVVEADAADGTFTADVLLPDGTERTSTPALGPGSHTLRFLSGSLKPNDAIRTVQSQPFVIGEYQPNGVPEPLDPQTLTAANAGGVSAALGSTNVTVTVPGRPAGTWVFVTAYLPDGSPRHAWGAAWHRLDRASTVTLPRESAGLSGQVKLVVQSGDLSEVGALLGWAPVTFPKAATPTPAPTTKTPSKPKSSSSSSKATTSKPKARSSTPRAQSAAGTDTAAAPVAARTLPLPAVVAFDALSAQPTGDATATVDGDILILRLPSGQPGDIVYLRVFSGTEIIETGWVTLDDASEVQLAIGLLDPGPLRISAQGEDGTVIGWVDAVRDGVVSEATSTVPVTAPADDDEAPRAWTTVGPRDAALAGAGVMVLGGALARQRFWRKEVAA